MLAAVTFHLAAVAGGTKRRGGPEVLTPFAEAGVPNEGPGRPPPFVHDG
jgi:hypothetical protein